MGETMRYHIDTIPVWDALHQEDECLLCLLRRKTEHMLTDRYLGASVMESDTRIRVNDKGFCPMHHQMLFALENRLGHALMMHSHLIEVRQRLAKLAKPEVPAGPLLFRRKAPAGDQQPGQQLRRLSQGCVLCDSLDDNMRRYAYTLVHLWKTDHNFQQAFLKSKGVCLPDCALLMDMAPSLLKADALSAFYQALDQLLAASLQRLEEELEWFTLKFDYRNQDKPWGNSRDALERTITKLRGWSVGKDPGLDK